MRLNVCIYRMRISMSVCGVRSIAGRNTKKKKYIIKNSAFFWAHTRSFGMLLLYIYIYVT